MESAGILYFIIKYCSQTKFITNKANKNQMKNIQKLFLVAISICLLSACKKESENIFTMFDAVTVTFNNSDPRSVVDYKTVNDKDEVWIDYTINSTNEEMYSVVVERTTGTGFDRQTFRPAATERKSYSNIFKYVFQRDGQTSFRVYALNQKGVYIGDGYKKVVVDVNPSYKIFTNRVVYLPDTTAKTLTSFFSLNNATAYNYTDGQTNADKIDFGIFRRAYFDANTNQTLYAINLYSPGTPVNPFPIYDINSWTPKRTTKFSAPIASQATAFLTSAVSGSTIEALAKARTINLNATVGTTAATGLVQGSAVFFLTQEGKYGMIYINAITSDYEKRPYINISVKMQN